MKRLGVLVAVCLILTLPALLVISVGCSVQQSQPPLQGEGFAIYLTKSDIPPSQMPAMSHFELADEPVIGMADIIFYDRQSHEIKLTSEAFIRIASLEVPVQGKSFVVCIDKQTVYWGAFWTPISSLSFDGVTIWQPLTTGESTVIKLELGYPSESFYGGTDPRNDARLMQVLEAADKLNR